MVENAWVTSLGLIAGALTTVSFVPQVVQIWRTKRAEDVSSHMFVIFSLGVFLWLIYGVYIHSVPIIVANIITLILCLSVLWLKWKCRERKC